MIKSKAKECFNGQMVVSTLELGTMGSNMVKGPMSVLMEIRDKASGI
jgi:hypothetical protein